MPALPPIPVQDWEAHKETRFTARTREEDAAISSLGSLEQEDAQRQQAREQAYQQRTQQEDASIAALAQAEQAETHQRERAVSDRYAREDADIARLAQLEQPEAAPPGMAGADGLSPQGLAGGPPTQRTAGSGLSRVYQDALDAGLDEEGARAAVAVARTEGGMGGSVGDGGVSAGTFQFHHAGGMGDAYAQQQGISREESIARLRADPHAGNRFALSGYLGQAIKEGQRRGLSGPALAEYAQRVGQRSVSPERAAQNYAAAVQEARGGGSVEPTADSSVLGTPPTPGQESSRYATARAPTRLEAVGQFEQGLPYEEAAAICGPVAALAFAQANGRNPSLAEVRALAKQTGWTEAGGMNGVANQKALLDRLGVKSRLDTAPDFGEIAADASSGNPVIISTPVHYYFASGADEQGRIFVGKTGTSRRGGGSWMTAQQIADLDGGINGVLYVDNPQSPEPSVAAMSTGDQEEDLPPAMRGVYTPADEGSGVGGSFAGGGSGVGRSWSDDPLDRYRPPRAERVPDFPVPDAIGRGVDAVRRVVSGVQDLDEQAFGPAAERQMDEMAQQAAARSGRSVGDERRAIQQAYDAANTFTGEPLHVVRGAARAVRGLEPLADALGQPGLSLQVTGGADPAERAAMPAVDTILSQWDQASRPGGPGVAQRLEEARTFLVRKLTDRRVDLNQAQNEVTRLVGGTLPPDMQVAELSRMNPTGAATLRVQNEVAPAIRAAGDDLPYVNALLAARGNVDVAAVKGQGRAFPGGVSAAQSADVPAQLQQTLGPDRFKIVSDATDAIVKVNQDLRRMLVDSGRITQATANEWAAKYPNYTPTQIVDYLSQESGLPLSGQGKSLGVRAPGLHALSEAGTERARLSPIASTINNVYAVENLARQQATFNALHNWVTRVPEVANRFTVERGAYSGTNAERAVSGFVDGERVSIVTPFEQMARVLRQEPTQRIPIIGPLMQVFKELITARNPAFLVGNALTDFPTYLVRETAAAGGMPTDTARAIGRYVAAVPDAFSGLLSGQFTGPATQRYLRQGGSMESWAQRVRSPADAERYAQELRRSGGVHLSSPQDVAQVAGSILSGRAFRTIGERVELVPRVAAFRAGEAAGLSPARAVVRGRDVTVDFAEGGTWAKTLNQAIPFLNPAAQGGANLARTIYRNPKGAGMTFALGLVAPTLAVEAWNHADPERDAAYADVPDYVKDRGWVLMLPGPGGRGVLTTRDERGNPKPQYLALNLREFAPIVDATRAAGDAAFGRETRTWGSLLGGALGQVVPTASVGDLSPLGARTALELGADTDFYRGSAIATASADERANAASRALAEGINAVAARAGAYPNVRPSQVEFASRENLGVLHQAATGASEILSGRKAGSTNPQDVPVAGGFLRRVVGNATGQRLENARAGRLDPDVRRTLYDTGLVADVATVPNDFRGTPLLQAEQTAYQERANQRVNEFLRGVLADPGFETLPPEVKKRLVSNVVAGAKAAAIGEVLATIGGDEIDRRRAAARAKKAG